MMKTKVYGMKGLKKAGAKKRAHGMTAMKKKTMHASKMGAKKKMMDMM